MVSTYFNKRRSLANGIAVSGASIGQFAIPPLLRYLVDTYSLRGALLIYGGLTLNVIVCGALFRPFTFYKKKKERLDNIENEEEEKCLKNDTGNADFVAKETESLVSVSEGANHVTVSNASIERTNEVSDNNIIHNDKKLDKTLYTSTGSLHLASQQNIAEKPEKTIQSTRNILSCCPWNKSGIRLFKFSLLKNHLFIIYVCGICFGNIGYVNPLLLLPKHAEDIGINKQMAAMLLSIAGIADFVGRVSGGWFSDLNLIRRSRLMSICLGLTGTASIVCSFFDTYASMVVFSIIMGAVGGSYISLMAVILVDFLGIENLPYAFGLTIMFMGASNLPVPSILGKEILRT